jgi:metal-responsive CopG/Arc/MetJ family transcriptional regulator
MSTINFSVPEDVKQAFNEAFQGQNKSAIITELMREAVERAQRRQRSREAIARILERRVHAPVTTEDAIRTARGEGRP